MRSLASGALILGMPRCKAAFRSSPSLLDFGLAEVLRNIESASGRFEVIKNIQRLMPPLSEMRRLWPMAVRGSIIGAFVGAISAAGLAIAVTVAYAQEKRMSKYPERYGTGIPEGIVAPELANNACVGGALVPMMTLGIPGDSMTAVLIGALLTYGLGRDCNYSRSGSISSLSFTSPCSLQ